MTNDMITTIASVKIDGKEYSLKYGGLPLSYRPVKMSAIIDYKYLEQETGNYYGIFVTLDPDAQSDTNFFICADNVSDGKITCFMVTDFTMTSSNLTFTGTRTAIANDVVDKGNSLIFPDTSEKIYSDFGKHYIENPNRKLWVNRTGFSIPYNAKAVLFIYTAGVNMERAKLPIVNYGRSAFIGEQSVLERFVNGTRTGDSITAFVNLGYENFYFPEGTVLHGTTSTIAKWNFGYSEG